LGTDEGRREALLLIVMIVILGPSVASWLGVPEGNLAVFDPETQTRRELTIGRMKE
jgi:hypothetical protein